MKTALGLLSATAMLATATAYGQDAATDPAMAADASAPAETAPADSGSGVELSEVSDSSASSSETSSTTVESTELVAPSYLGIQGLYTDPDSERSFGLANISR